MVTAPRGRAASRSAMTSAYSLLRTSARWSIFTAHPPRRTPPAWSRGTVPERQRAKRLDRWWLSRCSPLLQRGWGARDDPLPISDGLLGFENCHRSQDQPIETLARLKCAKRLPYGGQRSG